MPDGITESLERMLALKRCMCESNSRNYIKKSYTQKKSDAANVIFAVVEARAMATINIIGEKTIAKIQKPIPRFFFSESVASLFCVSVFESVGVPL
ncbi:hypothetical protein L4D15_12210 [Enterovibrio norvegicus]|uniref:hypothetical protein n=1 Tax=Enterovibrio norvegicus TaxID=188144 RepID=UPI003D0E2619